MVDVLIALALGGLLVWGISWVRTRRADETLDARFQALYREAKVKLPPEDLERLMALLIELRGTVLEAAKVEGWDGKRATREGKVAAIQSILGFLEIERMFTPQSKAA